MARRLISIFLIISSITYANEYNAVCEKGEISDPPFFISDEYKQGDKLYENLRSVEEPAKVETYLPRESLVKLEPELFNYSDHPEYRVPIKVISTPDEKREKSAIGVSGRGQRKRFRHTMSGTSNLSRAKSGTVGFIHKRSLKQVSNYVFILNADAPVFKTPGNIDPHSVALAFDLVDGQYQIERCCFENNEEQCFDRYKINLVDEEGEEIASKFIDIEKCGFFKHVHPVRKDIAKPVLPILEKVKEQEGFLGFTVGDLELLSPHQSWSGGRAVEKRPTLVKFPLNSKGIGPFNTYHYKPDDKKNSDAYLLPGTMCAFMSALEKFAEKCPADNPGCTVQIGNMYHHKSWNTHLSHWSGKCIDIRPLRSDNLEDYSNGMTYRSRAYSRSRTTALINELFDAGAYLVIFNDRKIRAKRTVKRDSKGIHDNHVHFCFDPAHKKVKEACAR